MKECDNSTRKIRISSNFILSMTLLIMFDTLLLRPSLNCNTPLHFTQQHFSTQMVAVCPYPDPDDDSPHPNIVFLRANLLLSCHQRLDLPNFLSHFLFYIYYFKTVV